MHLILEKMDLMTFPKSPFSATFQQDFALLTYYANDVFEILHWNCQITSHIFVSHIHNKVSILFHEFFLMSLKSATILHFHEFLFTLFYYLNSGKLFWRKILASNFGRYSGFKPFSAKIRECFTTIMNQLEMQRNRSFVSAETIWIFPRLFKFRYLQILIPFRCTIYI